MESIQFKLASGKYGCFSNFYKKNFVVDGIVWHTSEHLYQYRKIKFLQSIGEQVSEEFLQSIIDAKTPKEVKARGHLNLNNIGKWNDIKVSEMMNILREKFKYERFKYILLETGDATIIESSAYDTFWGDGRFKNGLNMLGKCLMRLREELRT